MTALAAPRKIIKLDGPDFFGPLLVKGGVVLYHGQLAALVGGYVAPATTASDSVIGVVNLEVWDDLSNVQGESFLLAKLPGTTGNSIDNTAGADGDRQVVVEVGVFKFGNKAGDLLDQTNIRGAASVEDDQTVRATAAGSITAGTVVRIDDDGGVFVQVPAGAYGHV